MKWKVSSGMEKSPFKTFSMEKDRSFNPEPAGDVAAGVVLLEVSFVGIKITIKNKSNNAIKAKSKA